MSDPAGSRLAPVPGRLQGPHAPPRRDLDEQMASFAYRWMPFGGAADDEILVEFGLTPVSFYIRVIDVLENRTPPEPLRHSHNAFRDYCRRRVREHAMSKRS